MSKTTWPNYTKFVCMLSIAVARFFSMLCTSGFLNGVMFLYDGPMARYVYFQAAIECYKHNSRYSNQILPNNKDQQA